MVFYEELDYLGVPTG